MGKQTIEINLESYLCEFLHGYYHQSEQILITKDSFLGHFIYENVDRVPENCVFHQPLDLKKRTLRLEVGWLGNKKERRKDPQYYFYLPESKQFFIEKFVRTIFDEILCCFLDITREKSEEDLKVLIEHFCIYYSMDFAVYYETLKKKYYRARQNKINAPVSSESKGFQLQIF